MGCAVLALSPVLHLWAGLVAVLCGVIGLRRASGLAGRGRWVAGSALAMGGVMSLVVLFPLVASLVGSSPVDETRIAVDETRIAVDETRIAVDETRIAALFSETNFVRISAGEFMMGSTNGVDDEQPVHRVRISREFEMGKYEVTQAQWEAVMGNNHSRFEGPDLPVEQVSWNDAQEFINKLNQSDNKYQYRLPTEAEWEYAARAGSTGDYAGDLDAMAWYYINSGNTTHPVGQKQANAWGLYDMHGNVWEWVRDWYDSGYYAQSPGADPRGPSSGSSRVSRGGGWGSLARNCRSAVRSSGSPVLRYYYLGLRLVRTAR
jgi:formylglycine-generating enzyme required for sulfatase activity